jgi:cob(I)alamin adenosyltransferase
MRSISTTRGDGGETGLAGGVRVSKASLRVDALGTVDELNTALGFARAICDDPEIRELAKQVQTELFTVCSALATPPESPKPQVPITSDMVEALTSAVHRFEAIDGVLADWSMSGELATAAAFDVARTVCRRAERCVVRLAESGAVLSPSTLPYLNRLSDLLWIAGRKLERDAGVSGSLREVTGKAGNRFSRAW